MVFLFSISVFPSAMLQAFSFLLGFAAELRAVSYKRIQEIQGSSETILSTAADSSDGRAPASHNCS